jgi:uncharacterized damage-inducible protein DinB
MTVSDLEALYDYGSWANRRLLEGVSRMTPEEFTRVVAGGHGSIRNTLVHLVSAEWGWLERCGGPARGPKLSPEAFPTLESLIGVWDRVGSSMRQFLSGLTDEDLDRLAHYENPRGEKRSMPIGELLHHAAVHGVHHRGQVATLLRLLGHAPGEFDLLRYYAERRGVPAF